MADDFEERESEQLDVQHYLAIAPAPAHAHFDPAVSGMARSVGCKLGSAASV